MISIDADSRLRYERLCSRGRTGDTDSWEKFVEQEKKEENNDDPNKQQLSRTMKMADYNIDNSGTLRSWKHKSTEFFPVYKLNRMLLRKHECNWH